jgi:hypothetical protein
MSSDSPVVERFGDASLELGQAGRTGPRTRGTRDRFFDLTGLMGRIMRLTQLNELKLWGKCLKKWYLSAPSQHPNVTVSASSHIPG